MNRILGTLITLGLATSADLAAVKSTREDVCKIEIPAPCYSQDNHSCNVCFGPENVAGSPAISPFTCDGDYLFTISSFYWNAHEDGLGFAIENNSFSNQEANALVHASIINPHFKWDVGWKLGFGYTSARDGWDFGLLWTSYDGKARANPEADPEDFDVLLPLLSDFVPLKNDIAPILEANKINARWKLELNMVDAEVGREFWNSKYLILRPHAGLRFLFVDQEYKLRHRGQSWGASVNNGPLNDFISMNNYFHGVGVRAGMDTEWLFSSGWSVLANASYGIIYGRFKVGQREHVRVATSADERTKILGTEENFHATKATTDIALGVQYSTMLNDCKYLFTIGLAWENHLFFNQNQLWKVSRIDTATGTGSLPNNNGENLFSKTRGDLSTQGWTLTAHIDF